MIKKCRIISIKEGIGTSWGCFSGGAEAGNGFWCLNSEWGEELE